ncbi:MAG: 4-hydroxy-tetrahydrodipicolinate reductase [Bacillota bacterium]|nr:4-hydroxy-tetrahydrodipicolinate reductase [Bacillota bacterium]
MIRILLSGAYGKMGRAMAANILKEDDMRIVAAVDVKGVGEDVGLLAGCAAAGVSVGGDLRGAIESARPDVLLDFTNAQAANKNARLALSMGLPCVVGTTGLSDADLAELSALSLAHDAPLFIAANFALSAVLMMRFAAEAAKYFPDYEIVEMHGENKLDAPSGTALATMKMIAAAREAQPSAAQGGYELLSGCRGGEYQGGRVHSLRLPGAVAAQECLFGGLGQYLSIRHDATSRECFYPGVALALRRIGGLRGLVMGLEQII